MSINKGCKLLGKSKSTFFEVRKNRLAKKKKEKLIEKFILDKVSRIRKLMPRIGGRKLYYLISKDPQRSQFKFGERKFFHVLREHNLLIKKRKRRIFTTDSKLWRGQFDNLLENESITRPEQLWVADITYIRTKSRFVYAHLITDTYSKKLMGAVVSDNMRATSTLAALEMAIENRQYNEPLIHHSDRGYQYLSSTYTEHLKKNNIQISVTQNGSPYDNPVAERINGILKDEFNLGAIIPNFEEAKIMLEKAVQIYNGMRPHWSNHLLTPNEMHQQRKLKMITWEKNPKND